MHYNSINNSIIVEISEFLFLEHALDKNLHKKNIVKYIIWKN
jgi:hypothetical protein